jgi:2-oxoisovalerate dehydrogenase E2 component (dihydrolipoyl transacylase)
LVRAIARHPEVNGHFDDGDGKIRRFRAVHVGIATQTGRGLLVPVIRNAEARSIEEIASEIHRLSSAARSGKSAPEDLAGSTITVTSLGALGGIMATPIINPPELAIIGINRIREKLISDQGRIETRKVMNLSSSFDHRIIDGFVAASFIATLRGEIEGPQKG